MDKTVFYRKLDIETPEEFKFYENVAALLEEDDYIEPNLIRDLLKDIDTDVMAENIGSYFEDFCRNIPDSETDFYITVDSIGMALKGFLGSSLTDERIAEYADEIVRFRKWYVQDLNVFDRINGEGLSVRDARFNIIAAGFLDEKADYDFRTACDYVVEGYDVSLADMIEAEFDESDYEGFEEIDLEEESEGADID